MERHGLDGTRFCRIYRDGKRRCENVRDISYKNYGGRGIKRMRKSMPEFIKDMYSSYLEHAEKHGEKNTTIDRIDNNGHYCKENCRWATYKEQQNSRSNNTIIVLFGESMTVTAAFEKYGVTNAHTFWTRYCRNWDIEDCLFLPVVKGFNYKKYKDEKATRLVQNEMNQSK